MKTSRIKEQLVVWKDIPDYVGLYQVSNTGQIKSLPFINRRGYLLNERQMKPGLTSVGYLTVSLWKNEKPKTFAVHRLVAKTFIPNPETKPQVNHKNRNKADNNVENLEWTTPRENTRHATAKHINQFDLSGILVRSFDCMSDVNKYGFNHKSVSSVIRRGKSFMSHGYIWKYAKS